MLTILVPHLINRILATGSVFNCIRNAVSNQSLSNSYPITKWNHWGMSEQFSIIKVQTSENWISEQTAES